MLEKKFAETSFGQICYLEAGQGERTSVFLHGFLGRPLFVEETASLDREKNRRVVGPFFPGHGESFSLSTGFLFPQLVETTEEFLQKICPNQELDVIGHSLGGVVAWEISARQNITVKRAILINPGLGNLDQSVFGRILGYFQSVRVDFPKDSGLATLGLFFRQGSVDFKQLMQAQRLAELVMSTQVSKKEFPKDTEVVVMWGRQDKILRLSEYKDTLTAAPRIQIRDYDGGHHWFIAQPQLYLAELQKLL